MIPNRIVCKELILSTVATLGNGKKDNPFRNVTQVFDKDGTLIAENDPFFEPYTPRSIVEFAKWCIENGMKSEYVTEDEFYLWVKNLNLPL